MTNIILHGSCPCTIQPHLPFRDTLRIESVGEIGVLKWCPIMKHWTIALNPSIEVTRDFCDKIWAALLDYCANNSSRIREFDAISKAEQDFQTDWGITALAQNLTGVSDNVTPDMIEPGCDEPSIDVRLRYHDGTYSLFAGDSSYDTDHRGCWGSASVGANLTLDIAKGIATELLEQVLDHVAQSQ